MTIHFGVNVREGKYGLKLTREYYAVIDKKNSLSKFNSIIYEDELGKIYTDEWCRNHMEDCMKNYDLNIQYFSALNHLEFDKEINHFLVKNKNFTEISNLDEYEQRSGYYILVLDEYCQLYVGTTDNIRKRVTEHWSKKIQFDRLLFPMGAVNTSCMSIDSFRALDTTRIFVNTVDRTYEKENSFINQFSNKFVCNRISGGRIFEEFNISNFTVKSRRLSE